MANMKAEVRYNDTTGEGVEKATLLSSGRMVAKIKANDLRVVNTTSKVEESFRTRLLETLGDKGVSIIEACIIEEGEECEAYGVEGIATDNDIEAKVAKDNLMMYGGVEDSSPLILETSTYI